MQRLEKYNSLMGFNSVPEKSTLKDKPCVLDDKATCHETHCTGRPTYIFNQLGCEECVCDKHITCLYSIMEPGKHFLLNREQIVALDANKLDKLNMGFIISLFVRTVIKPQLSQRIGMYGQEPFVWLINLDNLPDLSNNLAKWEFATMSLSKLMSILTKSDMNMVDNSSPTEQCLVFLKNENGASRIAFRFGVDNQHLIN